MKCLTNRKQLPMFLWQSSDWEIWLTLFLVLSKFFLVLCKDRVKGFISMIVLGTHLLFPLSEWHKLQEGLWHHSCTGCFMLRHLQARGVGGRGNAILRSCKARWWHISLPPFLHGVWLNSLCCSPHPPARDSAEGALADISHVSTRGGCQYSYTM